MDDASSPTSEPDSATALSAADVAVGSEPAESARVAQLEAEVSEWKNRFNGLQSSHQRALAAQKTQPVAPSKPEVPTVSEQEPQALSLEQQVAVLAANLHERDMSDARTAVVSKHPVLAPLREYLNAESPEALHQLAEEMAGKLAPPADTPAAPETAASTSPPVLAGTPAANGGPSLQEELAEAKRRSDWHGEKGTRGYFAIKADIDALATTT